MTAVGRKKWREVVVSAAIGTPLLFLAIEGVLRLAGVEPRPRVLVDTRQCYVELEPGTHVSQTLNGLVHDLWLDSRGFRVSEAVARGEEIVPPSACRVLALGDSFTEGSFVAPEQAWPGQVERTLRGDGYDVRVDNAGFRGRSIVEERFAALTRFAALHHDLVVIEHTANDIEDLVYAERDGCVPPRFTLFRNWRINRLAEEAATRLPFGRAASRSDPPTEAECVAMSREYRRQLVDTARGVRARGGRFLFALIEQFGCAGFGALDEAQYRLRWEGYVNGLRSELAEAGADFADASDALRVPGRSLRPADSHPNAAGHAAIAQKIAATIEDSGSLDRCRSSPESAR